MGQTLRNIWQQKIWSGQVRSRSYDVIRGTTSGNFSNKVVFSRNLTWQMTWQIDANDNIWTWLGQDVARLEFAHCQWPRLTSHLPQITNFVLRTVSLGGGFVLHGSFRIYVTMTDIPIIFEYQVADSWRHKFDLWRHRGDTVSFMSTIHPKYSTEMHQNTTFYAELNGGTRWWRFHVATISSFWDMDSWNWKKHGISENLTFDLS